MYLIKLSDEQFAERIKGKDPNYLKQVKRSIGLKIAKIEKKEKELGFMIKYIQEDNKRIEEYKESKFLMEGIVYHISNREIIMV